MNLEEELERVIEAGKKIGAYSLAAMIIVREVKEAIAVLRYAPAYMRGSDAFQTLADRLEKAVTTFSSAHEEIERARQ